MDGRDAVSTRAGGEGAGGLRWPATLPLVVKGEEGRLWFAGVGRRQAATMGAMEREREHGRERDVVWEVRGGRERAMRGQIRGRE